MCEKIFLRPSLDEIYDVQWSPDSMFILAGAINSKVCLSYLHYILCLIFTASYIAFRHPILRCRNAFVAFECCTSYHAETSQNLLCRQLYLSNFLLLTQHPSGWDRANPYEGEGIFDFNRTYRIRAGSSVGPSRWNGGDAKRWQNMQSAHGKCMKCVEWKKEEEQKLGSAHETWHANYRLVSWGAECSANVILLDKRAVPR